MSVEDIGDRLKNLLTENFYRFVLEIILGSNAAKIRDVEFVVGLIENDHVRLCESATSGSDKAVSLVDKLRVFLKHVMFHACTSASPCQLVYLIQPKRSPSTYHIRKGSDAFELPRQMFNTEIAKDKAEWSHHIDKCTRAIPQLPILWL